MFLISSCMFTVFPTPAPPKRPTLPPFAKGQIKSITLMPVSNNSEESAWSSNEGGFLCIGMVSFDLIFPFSSMGSPKTFIILPKVPSPTGTAIDSLVFVTGTPLFRPSEAPMAIVLTIPSPSCCWTSSTRPVSSTLRAS